MSKRNSISKYDLHANFNQKRQKLNLQQLMCLEISSIIPTNVMTICGNVNSNINICSLLTIIGHNVFFAAKLVILGILRY